jgi:hypothetical protein
LTETTHRITPLDDFEDLAEAFYLANGYAPELVSHWDPKPEFAQEIEKWLVRETRPSSIIQYVYSSYLEVDDRIKQRLEKITVAVQFLPNREPPLSPVAVCALGSSGT